MLSTTISAGNLWVLAGGTVDETTLANGSATLYVDSNASAFHTTINGGSAIVKGLLSGGTMGDGGYFDVNDNWVDAGQIRVFSGGVLADISSAKNITIGYGASAYNIEFSSGNNDISGASINGTEVSAYLSGGSIINGSLEVDRGGVVSGIRVLGTDADNTGTIQVTNGTVYNAVTSGYGNLTITNTGSVYNLSANGGGITMSGGFLSGGTFENGGTMTVSAGTVSNVTLGSGGHGFINGGTQWVKSGVAIDTIVSGGTLNVQSGGVTSGTMVTGDGSGDDFEGVGGKGSGTSISATIGTGGFQYIYSNGTASALTVENGGASYITSGGTLSGATVSSGGKIGLSAGAILAGTLSLQNGGTATIYSDAGGTIVMDGDTNTGLVISGLTEGGIVTTVISGFNGTTGGDSDGIVLAGIKQGDVHDVAYDSNDPNQVWINLTNGHAIGLTIEGVSSHGNALVVGDNNNLVYEVCFLAGSMIRTSESDVAVEDLQIGDDVIAFDWRNNTDVIREVVWIGKARATVRPELSDDEAGWPVRILKDAVSDGVPYKDMLITAEHCLFFKDRFVPVRMLVNGASIFYDKSITSYDYYHVETEQHSVITADGMLTESYLDTGNRSSFRQEGTIVTLRGSVKSWIDDAGAPLEVDRSFVESLFHALKWRENSVAGCQIPAETVEITNDPDLHLITQMGAVIRPMRRTANRYSFMLPSETHSVRILSRASRPSDVIGPFVDDRRYMGVAVAEVQLQCAKKLCDITAHLQEKMLVGWHDTDWTDCAWTDGDAELPLGDHLTHGEMGILSITVRAAGPYHVRTKQTVASAFKSA
ncbi:hypothetical protein EOV40_014620 (plasmid) [Acetobacter oryzoeni]|uniref:Hedgehog/Intein (Hint) domain-containing protein n=2 Tax=Acetobacter oryzoeni TaxID=2500548 RepID=A0A5B9GL23_9PROT|nr:hypothetical protein EOV40_014620 [Acetobacter oryzoeni]